MKSTFRTLFYLKRNESKKNGTVVIMVRITVDGDQTQFSSKLDIHPDLWDTPNSKAVGRSERFGKVLQKWQSITINRQDKSTSINTQMDSLIPPSKISGLTQGMFVGSVSDNFTEHIEQKIFHAEIVVDSDKVKREESAYKKIPIITDFTDAEGNDRMKEQIQENYNRIKTEVKQIVADELKRIADAHLIQQK